MDSYQLYDLRVQRKQEKRTDGYCYGWVLNSRLVCVAGVFQVGSLLQFVLPDPRHLIDSECHTQNAQKPS